MECEKIKIKVNFLHFADTSQSDCDLELQTEGRVPPLFEHGFFEIHTRLENKVIKANCMSCQRMGRANLIQAREYSSSNLLAHLKVNPLN